MSASATPRCKHDVLSFECSEHSQEVGYKPWTALQRLAATLPANKVPKKADRQRYGPSEEDFPASSFPAPLVLPEDELSWEPIDDDPQNLKSWAEEPARNEVSPSRRTIYLVADPKIDSTAAYVKGWVRPQFSSEERRIPPRPKIEDVLDYLKAFYHGLPVKLLSRPQLKYVPWSGSSKGSPSYIGLHTGSEVFGIRTRPSKDKVFSRQLNLNGLLDVAIAILPKDAYALLMLTDHDLYEDEDDDFCCGRAYGGSRVAVVSSARYNPILDQEQNVETEHAWPASHCQAYIDTCCDSTAKAKKKKPGAAGALFAMYSAVEVFSSLAPPKSDYEVSTLWLSRICKTASHELGHCFGIAHCPYYACIMQGTAGLAEDARQPPYLCPVDLAKVLRATNADSLQHYRALLAFSDKFKRDRMFAAFAAWLRVRIDEVENRRDVIVID